MNPIHLIKKPKISHYMYFGVLRRKFKLIEIGRTCRFTTSLVISGADDKTNNLNNRPLYIEYPLLSDVNSSPVYEEIHEGGNDSLPELDEDFDGTRSDSLIIETTRNRRPSLRFGIDVTRLNSQWYSQLSKGDSLVKVDST